MPPAAAIAAAAALPPTPATAPPSPAIAPPTAGTTATTSGGGGGGAAAPVPPADDSLVAHLLTPTGDYRTAPNAIRLAWLAQLASQVADLHDTFVVHGDVRPARVRLLPLGDDETFRSVELGPLTKPTLGDVTRVLYLHPGLLDGSIKAPTHDTDVYALGVTAWHVLSGTPPFDAVFADGMAAYDERTAKALLSAYLARVPGGYALPAAPLLWQAEPTDLHRVWSARDRGGVTARSLAASLKWLAMQADRTGGSRCSVGWAPGRAMTLVVAVHDTAMARVRSCVMAVEPGDTMSVVKHEVERVTGYLAEEQRMTLPGGAVLTDDATVASAGLRHADAVTVTVGGKYGITVVVFREAGKVEEVVELEVAGGDMLDAAVLRPIAARYGSTIPGTRLSAYHDRQSCMLRDPATTTVRQHAIRPGSRINVIGPSLREAPGAVTITLKDGGEPLMFKVRRTTRMEKVREAYASKRGVSPEQIRFIFDGERVTDDLTPALLKMKDGDEINVMLERSGD